MKAIEASPKSVNDLLQGHEFVIPEYQRPYSWGRDECVQLWDDLSDFLDRATDGVDDDKDQYFLGSIVVYPNPDNNKVWDVIDGQQRLTTLLMIVRALFAKAATHSILQKRIYKEDPKTGEIDARSPRLESKVLGENDRESLAQVLAGDLSDLEEKDGKNLFLNNYRLLEEQLTAWWKDKSAALREKTIGAFLNNVVLLPIECASADDALTLFQIVNDRGKPLGDSDIFKAELYRAVGKSERDSFIARWKGIGPRKTRELMFRVFMHISRAERNDFGKEIDLRKYVRKNHLNDKVKLSSEWREIMNALEACRYAHYYPTSDDDRMIADENIYWGVLYALPNAYWQYPLHVFLHKHMERTGDEFVLPSAMHEEYKSLLQDTVRYFFIKAVAHNSVNAVKDAAFKVCADIRQGRDYAAQYRDNAGKKDLEEFERKLKDSDLGRCRSGLVFLAAALNPNQDRAAYGDFLQGEKVNIEHILPRQWCNYDEWNDESHGRNVDKIGNLMPLEKKLNIKASNEFFEKKKKEYAKSKVQDALDLAKKSPAVWYPADVAKRHEESLARLLEFFRRLRR